MVYDNIPIEIVPGVQPDTDFTPQSTPHAVESDMVRWVDGFPEKNGGWLSVDTDTLRGCARNIFSYNLSGNINYIIGTHTHLYNLLGTTLTNITPVETTTTTLNNVLATFYGTLGNDPIETTNGSSVITITDTAHRFQNGDIVTLSGSTAVNGITAVQINASHTVANVTTNTYQVTTTGEATSDGSGGGAAVVRASRIVTVTDTNDFQDGDNIVISNLGVPVGGIAAGSINGTRRIRNVSGSAYDIIADATATSAASNAGGNIDIAEQIEEGVCDPTVGLGYGLGQYGVGLYGVAKQASSPTLPSIYSFDRFGDLIVFTRGTQTGLYSWSGSLTTLPALVTNAPTAIEYVFVSNEIAVTLGAAGVGNRIQWCDQANLTTWAETAENRAGQDDIEGAGDFISHAKLRGFNLLFTRDQVYSFRYIDLPFVWETRQIDPARGLIARNARVVVNGVCYWMGRDNFYFYRGGNVEIVPANTISQSTVKKFVFESINTAQESKIFAWYNEEFNEIWWHYPSGVSVECDRVVVYNVRTNVWFTHTLSRNAAEYPATIGSFPYLTEPNSDRTANIVYQHERGVNDDTSPLAFSLTSPFRNSGTQPVALGGIHFDDIRTGDLTLTLNTKFYPKDTAVSTEYTVADTTYKLSYRRRGRFWQYKIEGNVLNQSWRAGQWSEEVKPSGRK